MSDANLIRCPGCGADNRVPRDKIESGLTAICGRCKTPLPLAAAPLTVTDASFSNDVEHSPLPVLVELAAEMTGRVRVAKLNVDENPATASRFDLRSIPTLLIFKGGREIDRIVGVHPKA